MTKLYKWLGICLCATMAVIFISSCNTSNSSEIKIGAILPLSGEAATYGKSARQGIEIGLDLARKLDPKSPKIVVAYEDTQADPKLGVAAFRKLVNIEKVKVVIGEIASSVTLAVAPVAEAEKVVLISPASSAPKITEAGDYIFRTAYSDIYEGKVLAHYAVSELKLKSLAVLYINNDYGIGFKDEFEKTAKSLGSKIVAQEGFAQGATDFRTQLTKMKNASPDGIVLLGYKELGTALLQIKQLGVKAQILSSVMFEDPDVLKVAGSAAEGVHYSYPAYNPESKNKEIATFTEAYKSKFGDKPDIYAALSYDTARIVANAIKSGGNDADVIKKYLYSTKDYQGATGLTSFDSNGDVVKNIGIKKVKSGSFIWVKE